MPAPTPSTPEQTRLDEHLDAAFASMELSETRNASTRRGAVVRYTFLAAAAIALPLLALRYLL